MQPMACSLLMESLSVVLEDEVRDVKVMHETAIPLGEYEIKYRTVGGWFTREKARYDKKFGASWFKGMLELQDVPNFTYVLIHSGNTDESTSACLLLGKYSTRFRYG